MAANKAGETWRSSQCVVSVAKQKAQPWFGAANPRFRMLGRFESLPERWWAGADLAQL